MLERRTRLAGKTCGSVGNRAQPLDAILNTMGSAYTYTKWLLLLAGVLSCTSCWVLMPNCHKRFTTYQIAVQGNPSHSIHFDGMYVSEELSQVLLFEPSGLIKIFPNCVPDTGFWASPLQTISTITLRDKHWAREHWGTYSIEQDSIHIQFFNYHQTEGCKRSVFDYRGVLLNDTTFVITSKIAYWFDDTATTGHFVYRFYPTDFKPDDSRIWFEKKRWYLRNRDPSRAK